MKFIHIADLHLGAEPDAGRAYSQNRSQELWETLQSVLEVCEEEQTDLLLIAGDIFHGQPLRRELKELNYYFAELTHTKVVLIAGNHDYIRKDSYYRTFQWNENVIPLFGRELEYVEFPELRTAVYGLSYYSREIREPLYESAFAGGIQEYEILLAHGGDEKHCPFRVKKLEESGFDYIALGHIHKPQILIRDNAAYAGALEPVDRNDLGDHGYIEGHLENGRLKTNFVPFACRSYEQILLMLREDSTQASLEDMLKADLANKGRMNIYRIVIQGTRAPELLLLPERLKSFGYVTEVLDESKPSYDLEALQKKYSGTLIGDYISYFLEKDRNAVEEKALYYGLQALLETSR